MEQVWSFVTSPTSRLLMLLPHILEAFRVPGSPIGQVGELWCILGESRFPWVLGASVLEVVEFEPGRSIAVRDRTYGEGQMLQRWTVAPSRRGCHVRADIEGRFRRGQDGAKELARNYLHRLRKVIDGASPRLTFSPRPIDRSATPALVVGADIDIARPVDHVWQFACDPSNSVLTNSTVVHGFRVPGGPVGQVGDRSCLVSRREGGLLKTSVYEAVETVWGRRQVRRILTARSPALFTQTFDPVGQGCRMSASWEYFDQPADLLDPLRQESEAILSTYLGKTKALLEQDGSPGNASRHG